MHEIEHNPNRDPSTFSSGGCVFVPYAFLLYSISRVLYNFTKVNQHVCCELCHYAHGILFSKLSTTRRVVNATLTGMTQVTDNTQMMSKSFQYIGMPRYRHFQSMYSLVP